MPYRVWFLTLSVRWRGDHCCNVPPSPLLPSLVPSCALSLYSGKDTETKGENDSVCVLVCVYIGEKSQSTSDRAQVDSEKAWHPHTDLHQRCSYEIYLKSHKKEQAVMKTASLLQLWTCQTSCDIWTNYSNKIICKIVINWASKLELELQTQ